MSLPKRLLALRVDFLVQTIWLMVVAYEGILLSSEGWNDDVTAGILGLLVWQIVSSVAFIIWQGREAAALRWWRRAAAVALLSALALQIVGALMGVVLAIVSLSEDPLEWMAGGLTWLTLPVVLGYFGLTFWETWLGKAAHRATVDEQKAARAEERSEEAPSPSPTGTNELKAKPVIAPAPTHTPLWPLVAPWLRFVIPLGLLVVALNHFYVNLGWQIAGEDWSPAAFCAAVLLVGWVFTWGLKNRPEGWPFRIWSRLWWLAALPLLLLGLTFVPFIRHQIREVDHARVLSWESYPGPLAAAQRRHLYSAELGPDLLRRRELIEAHLKQYEADLSPYTDLRADRHALALYVAALRLNGKSVEEIAALPLGPLLITGAVLAEAEPPYWMPKASWLWKELGAQPEGSFRLGLVDRAQAGRLLEGWIDEAHLEEVMTPQELRDYDPFKNDPKRWRAHGRGVALAEGLLNACLRHDRLLSDAAIGRLLTLHERRTAPPDSQRSVVEAMAAREKFRHWASSQVKEDGTLPLRLTLDPMHFPYRRTQELLREKLGDFIRSCGYRPEWKEGPPALGETPGELPSLTVKLSAQLFDDLPQTSQSSHLRTRAKTVRRLRPGRLTGYDTRQITETYVETVEHESRGPLTVASLEVTLGEESLILRPAGVVDKSNSDIVLDWMKHGKFPVSTDYLSVITAYYHLADTALSGWRYGVPTWNDPASQLFWDGWSDVAPDSPVWE